MPKSLLPPPAASRQFRRLLGTAAGFALMLAATPAAQAQTIFGLSGTDLTSINLASPNNSQTRVAITGVTAGQTLVGIDFRPATGELFALGYDASATGDNARLYVLNQSTAVATPVGSGAIRLELGGSSDRIAFDFNPTVDRIRVAGTNDANYRLNPNNGAIVDSDPNTAGTQPDGTLAYVAGDANAGQNPFIGTAAYTNSFIGTTSTTLYYIDEQRSLLVRSDSPNTGTLATVATINPTAGGNPTPINAPGASTDLDIYTVGPNDQQSYLNVNQVDGSGNFFSFIYRLNLATGATSFVGLVNGTGVGITDIAVRIDRTALAPSGRLLYAVSSNSSLLSFYSGTPGYINSAVAITGIATGQTLVGTDFRPNTGELFGLGYNTSTGESRLYTIDLPTAVATPVGSGPITLSLGGATDNIGFDFNPTVDRIRVVSTNRADYRLNPNNGALAFTDGTLTYAGTDTNNGQTPRVGSVGYTNSYPGSTSTTLYDIDEARNTLTTQSPPNSGTLNTVGTLGVPLSASNALVDMDVYFDRTNLVNEAYLAANPNGQTTSNLYTLALGSGGTTLVGAIGLGIPVRDISAQLAGADASATLSGRLLYGVAGGNLVSFDSNNPGIIRTAVNITGLPTDGSQVLVGMDFSPATGELFALGYNAAATSQQGQLYTLNISTGALTAVGSLNFYGLGTTAASIGFDFNPTVNLIRVVSGANQANLRVSPVTGTVVSTDSNLSNPSGTPVLTGVAYTNNDNNANTGTTLYGIDQARNVLVRSTNANAGTYVDQGSLGMTLNPALGADFDIYSDLSNPASPVNSAFLAAAVSNNTFDNLYTINLATGATSSGAKIGNGSDLTGLAAFLTPGPAIAAGLVWTGATNTDWGTAGNWSPAQVPTATDNVTITDVANDPVASGTQAVNGLTLTSGAVLTLADASVLNVSGNITNNSATVTFQGTGTGRVTLAGTAAQSIGGTLTTFPNLTTSVAAATNIGGPVAIRRGLTVRNTLAAGTGQLTLLSSAAGTAYIVSNGNTITGNVTVQRYIDPSLNNGGGYRHYSAPVSNTTVGDLATSNFTPVVNPNYNTQGNTVTPFPTVFGYDETRVNTSGGTGSTDFDKGFFSPSALGDAMVVSRGYTVNIPAAALVDFVGTPNDGATPIVASGLTRGAQAESGWHLRGNPFPSALDWNLMVSNNRLGGVNNALYVFKSSGQYTGSYAAYVGGFGTNGGTNVVPLGQGFFVRTTTAGTSGSLTFTNSERITTFDATPFQRNAADTRPQLTLALGNATARTQAIVYMEAGATAGYDRAFDASFLPGSNGLVLALEAGAERLAIDGLPALTGADVTVPLHVAAATAGTYTLQVDDLAHLPAGYFAYLRDGLTGAYTSLTPGTSMSLTLAANTAAGGRYAVVFTTQSRTLATVPAALAQQVAVYPNPATSTVTIALPAALGRVAVVATLLDAVGREVRTFSLPAQGVTAHQFDLHQPAPGIYTLRLSTSAGVVAKKLVVE